MGVKRPVREADHSPPSSTEVKEQVELHLHSPNTFSWRGVQLKHRDNFTFMYYPVLKYPLSTYFPHHTGPSKVKVKLSLCPVLFLTKHHAMKAYWGSGCIAPLIL
jgi:hypothetical protein